MDSAADMHARHAQGLAELAELGLAVARDLQRRQGQAEADEDAAKLAVAFHHVSRTVRQTWALEARLHRDADRDARDEADRLERAETRAHNDRVIRHSRRVRAQLDRLIWTEQEDEELEDTLYGLIADAQAEDDFLDTPVDVLVDRIRKDLGRQVPPPQGEGDREAVEGVEAPFGLSQPPPTAAPFNPLSRSATAPPEGEQSRHRGPATTPTMALRPARRVRPQRRDRRRPDT